MFGKLIQSTANNVADFMENPISKTIEVASQPIVDGCDLIQGLTEGEFREQAAIRLGADVVAGMAISEIIEALGD